MVYHSDFVFEVNSTPGEGTFTCIEFPVQEGMSRRWSSKEMPISCIIVDDEQPALEELNFLLSSLAEVKVIGQGHNGVEAIKLVGGTRA